MTTCCSFGAHLALSAPLVQRDQREAGLRKTSVGRRTKPSGRALVVTPSANKDFAGEVGSLKLAAGQTPAERYIATNRFKVKKGAEAKFEKRWAERKSRLAELDGFQFFTIMRRVTLEGEDLDPAEFNYTSYTVWDNKENFTKWRTGEAFKEAHGGGTLFGFVAMLVSSTFTLEGTPKPAFYEGILPLSVPQSDAPEVEGGWRNVKADGVNCIEPDCFVAMNRFKIAKGQEAAFEQRWANRESSLKELPGFVNFHMLRRDADKAEDGYNFVSATVWKDRASFDSWRASQSFKKAHGQVSKPAEGKGGEGEKPAGPLGGAMGMMLEPPSPAFFEGKLMLAVDSIKAPRAKAVL
mmetsp:Transcript_905/g.1599  ORF Transcript_905/g.1599 Transcript_905/m.1599 type:complete len:352 (+) Transcript_905:111-1166(+)|eukprot:CAMPEP_0198200464 /NCGR_PEP_ID=MMETSP1445-20131203/3474_1 /TAXON_ID=36898 /ORGANISM="Pyramimonas sp., Strain CCMP2087" /LENGTH=351 /DNA_ID=CAMNT_0043870541 /DNA_START=75 /DNA_END=1130 /DNA_ORIENTATION=+